MKASHRSILENMAELVFVKNGLTPEREYRFHPKRRWRFDFAWPDEKLAVEVEGGQWVIGRHQQPEGFEKDMEKYNAAVLAGWRVLRFTGKMVQDGTAVAIIKEALGEKAGT